MKNQTKKFLAIATIIVAGSIAVLIGASYGKQQLISNIQIEGLNLSGQSYDEAAEKLEDQYALILDAPFSIEFEGSKLQTTLRKLGVYIDAFQTLELAYETSQEIGIPNIIQAEILGANEPLEVDSIYKIDKDIMIEEIILLVASVSSGGEDIDFEDAHSQIVTYLTKSKESPVKLKKKYTEEQIIENTKLRTDLLSRSIVFNSPPNSFEYTKEFQVKEDWFSIEYGQVKYNKEIVKDFVASNIAPEINLQPQNSIITKAPEEGGVYVETLGTAKDGRTLDIETTVNRAMIGLASNTPITLAINATQGQVINQTDHDLGKLTLLGRGKSNFEGSPEGRDFNIRKGLSEKYNNVLIAPGESFSYNALLGPVTHSAGWKDSLAIFGGQNLRPVPGGGLCQVSTTIYRALVNTGLKVTEKSNHSLYVHYYKAYGDGLDSAIYPGSKDLRFENDTNNYILIQAYAEENDAYVDIYGTPDGRTVELTGPIYANSIPDGYNGDVRSRWNQIKWVQKIIRADGEVEENILTSTYRTAPR